MQKPPHPHRRITPDIASVLFRIEGLQMGCRSGGKRPCRRSPRSERPEEAVPSLGNVEEDGDGRVAYVDLAVGGEHTVMLDALRTRLLVVRPAQRDLERLPLINRNRVLVEVDDARTLDLLSTWLKAVLSARNSIISNAFRRLVEPLGQEILLLGGHFICPRVTEYEPKVPPQTPHTDVATKGEVIGIGLHLEGQPMHTLIDTHATLDVNGLVQDGVGFRQANTSTFAFETGAVHAGPGQNSVLGPYPRFLTNRAFFLFCSADLTPAQIAQHRSDNGLVGRANLTIRLSPEH
jgi:hypothetical protein